LLPELVKEIGISWWRVLALAGLMSAINIYGFIAQIPKSFWPLIDSYFLSNYFLILGLSLSAATLFSHWLYTLLNSLSFWFSKVLRKVTRKQDLPQRESSKIFEFVAKLVIFFLLFGVIFSGSDYISHVFTNLFVVLVAIILGYFYIFVFHVDHGLPKRLTRRIFVAWIDDLIKITPAQVVGQIQIILPVLLLLIAIWSYWLGEARAVELMENDAYWAVGADGKILVPLVVTTSGVIFLSIDDQTTSKHGPSGKRFIFTTFSGSEMLSSLSESVQK
jgi:hypothetical protein